MKIRFSIGLLLVVAAFFALPAFESAAADINSYCQIPPFVNAVPSPNIMLAVDASGSMECTAYQQVTDAQRVCSGKTSKTCDPEHEKDCKRSDGVCVMKDGHLRCSENDNRDCDTNADCTYDYGTCSTQKSVAYGTCASSTITCDPNNATSVCGAGVECVPNEIYEGYFNPAKTYRKNATDGIYYEVANVQSCSTKFTYPCKSKKSGCTSGGSTTKPADALNTCSGGTPYYCTLSPGNPSATTCSGPDTGNWLNYQYMSRTDVLRWAMTGGSPATCAESTTTTTAIDSCDPRVFDTPSGKTKVGTVCSKTQKLSDDGTVLPSDGCGSDATKPCGCVLKARGAGSSSFCPSGTGTSSVQVAVPWKGRLEDGLTNQFSLMPVKPRMGAYFYSGSGVRANYIYLGDFTANAQTNEYPYQRLLTAVNAAAPSGTTPQGPAMWDILNYFKQVKPEYNGIDASSAADWKSPMKDCVDSGGGKCTYVPCAKNFVLLMSDGLWNQGGKPVSNSCSIDTGYEMNSADPVVASYQMHKGFTNSVMGVNSKVTAVYTVGMFLGTEGTRALKNTALYGSFDNETVSWPSGATDYPKVACKIADAGANCPSSNAKGSECTEPPTAADTFFGANNALDMRSSILNAVLGMLARASSGTAASVLASGEGSGANIVQSIFYPRRNFFPDEPNIAWTSTLQNLWYYLDPKTANSTIRENTADTGVTPELKVNQDNILHFWFDPDTQLTMARLYADADGDGLADTPLTPTSIVEATDLKFLWEAGTMLWKKNPDTRTIYVNVDNTYDMSLFTTNLLNTSVTFQGLLNTDATPARPAGLDKQVASDYVSYIQGYDFTPQTYGAETINYRVRKTAIDLTKDGDIADADEAAKVWKLGDVINSTPRIASWIPLNMYNTAYSDETYTKFINTADYKERGTVFTGANDGMLHAFKLGKLTLFKEQFKKAELQGTNLGEESWAFIPKSAIPYLQYFANEDYCHLYYVDATPVLFDASIGKNACSETNYWDCTRTESTWRTVLIGGMRQGGGCKPTTYVGTNGVVVPKDGVGYSSYFALDVTNPLVPKLLWEFAPTDGSLGFATSGPAIVRINARDFTATESKPNDKKNGRWFVVFASGPTGPVDQGFHQFKGHSDQKLKLFVLDLVGPGSGNNWTLNTNYWVKDTGLENAYGGSLYNGNVDYDLDYQDDAIYMGYVQSEVASPTATTEWNAGGILRYVMRAKLAGAAIADTALNPLKWELSTVRSGMGPISSAVSHLAHYAGKHSLPDKAYLYAGAGRYYFNTTAGVDDADGSRRLYAIIEPCLSKILDNESCSATVTGTLEDATNTGGGVTTTDATTNGWFIDLDPATATTGAERVITDPLASTMGAVFFTSFIPKKDACAFGGSTYLWAVKYDTAASVASALTGTGLMQVSTGAIEEVKLSEAFKAAKGGTDYERRSYALTGVPPLGQGLSIVVPPKPVDTMLHIRKK